MPTRREQYYENLRTGTEKAFEQHKVTKRPDGVYEVRREFVDEKGQTIRDGNGWMEVIHLRYGLYSGGDYDFVVFGNNTSDDKIAWMGAKPLGDSYVSEKAQIGMSGTSECLHRIDPDIFFEEAKEWLEEGLKDAMEELGKHQLGTPSYNEFEEDRANWESALRGHDKNGVVQFKPAKTFRKLLGRWDLEIEGESLGRFGRVQTSRLFCAHQAIRVVYKSLHDPTKV